MHSFITRREIEFIERFSKAAYSDYGYLDVDAYVVKRANGTYSMSTIITNSDGREHEVTLHGATERPRLVNFPLKLIVANISLNGKSRMFNGGEEFLQLLDLFRQDKRDVIADLIDRTVLTEIMGGVYLYTAIGRGNGILLDSPDKATIGSIGQIKIERIGFRYLLDGVMRVYQFPVMLTMETIAKIPRVAELKLPIKIHKEELFASVASYFTVVGNRENLLRFLEKSDEEKLALFIDAVATHTERLVATGRYELYMSSTELVNYKTSPIKGDIELLLGMHGVMHGLATGSRYININRSNPFLATALLRREDKTDLPVETFTFIGSSAERDTNYTGKRCFMFVDDEIDAAISVRNTSQNDSIVCRIYTEKMLNSGYLIFDQHRAAPIPTQDNHVGESWRDVAKLISSKIVAEKFLRVGHNDNRHTIVLQGPAEIMLLFEAGNGERWEETVIMPCGSVKASYEGRSAGIIILPATDSNVDPKRLYEATIESLELLAPGRGIKSVSDYVVDIAMRDPEVLRAVISFVRRGCDQTIRHEEKVVDR